MTPVQVGGARNIDVQLRGVQVGYKMRVFGDDAQIASDVCRIGCWQDRNYLTAGIPVHRLHVHVRRLVDAGHKVRRNLGT